MDVRTKTNLKKNIANFFGAVGYFSCSLQWLWTIVLYFSLIEAFALFISPNSNNHIIKYPIIVDSGSNTLQIIIVAAITIIMGVITVYILIKMPSVIAKTGKKIVHRTAENATPIVLRIQHKKDTKKGHRKLTLRLILIMKTLLILAPVMLSLASQFIEKQMITFSIAMYVSLGLACFSVIFFVFQYFVAAALSVKSSDLW